MLSQESFPALSSEDKNSNNNSKLHDAITVVAFKF